MIAWFIGKRVAMHADVWLTLIMCDVMLQHNQARSKGIEEKIRSRLSGEL